MSEDPLEERQEQEVEVLKAIYLDDFQDLRDRDVWKVRRPPEFTLRLRPNHDSTGQLPGHCSVLLRVKFGPDYPLKPPDVLEVREPRGLSDDLVRELSSALWSMAAKAVGEVMITELSQHTAAWLCAHDKPTFGSFYEEMEARNRAKTERKEQKLAVEREIHAKIESQELEAIREEVARKTEALQEERIKWKEEEKKRNHLGSSASDDAANPQQTVRGTTFRRQTSSSLSISESSDVGHGATLASVAAEEIWFVFKGERVKVDKLTKIGANVLGGSVSVGLLSSTSKLVAISEWSFRTQRVGTKKMPFDEVAHDLASLMKQIGSIEQEMTSIQKVTHPNVIQHIGLAHQKCPAHIKLYVFEDFVCGSNLSFYLSENLPLDLDVLKHYVTGILNALDFMHGHNIVHRDLRDTSVFVDSRGVVRVGDFSIDKRVRDLVQQAREGEERFPVAIGRGGKKVDIYRLGLLALSLAMGEIVQESAIPTKMFPPEYTDFLRKCLNKDERERWNALQLLEHKWLKQGVERSPLRNLGDQKDHLGRSSSPEAEDDGNDEPVAVPFVSVGTGQSRLQNEFSFISKIGKGGFGEVMKVKNNLDGQVYAIKKIKLNSKNKQAMKKLMREVKLLSRLNHENVVRYYTSWIEVTTIKEEKKEVETSFGEDSSASTPRRLLPDMMLSKSLAKNLPKKKSLLDNLHFGVNDLYHEQSDSDFSISFSSHQLQEDRVNPSSSSEDEDDDDDDDDDVFGTSFLPQSEAWADDDEDENSDIVFENSVNGDDIASSTANNSAIVAFASSAAANIATPKPKVPADQSSEVDDAEQKIEIRFMYIQMEYCDKQTLRNAIDGGLYKDTQRVWRMFREIIEGLVHIHTQAMIHRDLKPVNIFIDSHDHVKIGDFGLATTNVRGGKNMTFDHGNDSVDMESDMTGQIGTALYIAPEINIMRCTIYTQKVDIYSLGIIFFEMCYMPLQTGMERIKILTDLRSEDIRFPADFDESLYMQQRGILNLLLNHDPARRPNSQELLQSDFLPPPQVEEAELREMIRHTLANTKSTAYRHLIDSCLGQNMSPAQDISFDMEVTRDLVRSSSGKRSLTKILLGQEYVRRTVEQVFQRHGAISIQMCNLLPKGKQQIYDKGGVVQVMTRGGGVVMLSFDLRVAFARFLARAQISNIKRYCIAPVFREFQMFGYHPREQIEFAFDIVTPMEGSLLADAEVLYTADEILREFPSYSEVNYFFRLNHTHLLRGILLNSGICENFHQDIYNVIREGAGWSKLQRTTHLVNLGLSEQVVASFLNVLEHEGSPSNINGILRHLTRKKNAASTEIKQALNDLDAIIVKAKAMGTKCAMIVSPSLVYNPGHFSGMVCQLVRKKKRGYEIIAAGGRYDHLLNCFASNINLCNQADTSAAAHKELNQSAVGISLAMDKLHALVAGDLDNQFSAIEVLVYSENHMASMIKEKLELVSRLWSAGVKCVICDIFQTLEEVVIYAQEFSASFIVIMRDSESSVRIRCLDNDRFQERRVPMSDVFDFLVRSLKQQASEALEQSASSGTFHRTESNVKQGGSDSRVMNVQVNYNYRFLDKSKFNATTKKRLESTISTKITSLLHLLAQNTVVQVLALPLPRVVVKSMAAMLEFEDESAFRRSTPALLEKHSRYRKDLANICDEIQRLKFDKDYSVILLYSSEDHFFTTIFTT